MSDDFRSRVKLDKYNLDTNAIEQQDLYEEAGKIWALATQELDNAKLNLKIVEARLSKKIRTAPADYGLEKATDKSVQDIVILDSEYQTAAKKLIDAQYNVNALSEGKEKIIQRGFSLRVLSDLYNGNYFSTSVGKKFKEMGTDFTREAINKSLKEEDFKYKKPKQLLRKKDA